MRPPKELPSAPNGGSERPYRSGPLDPASYQKLTTVIRTENTRSQSTTIKPTLHTSWIEGSVCFFYYRSLTLVRAGVNRANVTIGKTKNTYAIFRSCTMRYSVKMKHQTK